MQRHRRRRRRSAARRARSGARGARQRSSALPPTLPPHSSNHVPSKDIAVASGRRGACRCGSTGERQQQQRGPVRAAPSAPPAGAACGRVSTLQPPVPSSRFMSMRCHASQVHDSAAVALQGTAAAHAPAAQVSSGCASAATARAAATHLHRAPAHNTPCLNVDAAPAANNTHYKPQTPPGRRAPTTHATCGRRSQTSLRRTTPRGWRSSRRARARTPPGC